MVVMDLGSPPLPKKSLPVPGPLEQVANRLSSKVAAEVPHGSKQELPDLKGEWPRWQGGGAGQASHTRRRAPGPGNECWAPGWPQLFLHPRAPRRHLSVFSLELLLP